MATDKQANNPQIVWETLPKLGDNAFLEDFLHCLRVSPIMRPIIMILFQETFCQNEQRRMMQGTKATL